MLTTANVLARLGRADDATATFEQLVARRPDDPEVRADFASLLLDMGLHERAREILNFD